MAQRARTAYAIVVGGKNNIDYIWNFIFKFKGKTQCFADLHVNKKLPSAGVPCSWSSLLLVSLIAMLYNTSAFQRSPSC